jgi:inorganic pyrophosphatase
MPGDDVVRCMVEIPKGSRNKYRWDEALGAIRLDRFLFSATIFPADYGFIPDTIGEDGQPLNVLVLVEAPTFPGCFIEVMPLGVLRTEDAEGQDDKLLCVPAGDPNWEGTRSLADVPQLLRTEIARFFGIYKEPEGTHVEIGGYEDRDVALELLGAARERWRARDQ